MATQNLMQYLEDLESRSSDPELLYSIIDNFLAGNSTDGPGSAAGTGTGATAARAEAAAREQAIAARRFIVRHLERFLAVLLRDLREGGLARRGSAEHLTATKALCCTAAAWMLIVAQCSANF